MSSCSNSSLGLTQSPSSLSQLFNMLDSAAELMMVHRDVQAAFDTCNRCLGDLASMDSEDDRCGELKAAFCSLGIQALAELNQWRGVLSWVLQQYEHQESIPAKIMKLCILLYSKVGEPAMMQETTRVWVRCTSNCKAPGFQTVTELYLLHVLVPLEHLEEARELILGEVGGAVFTEDQRQTALDVVEEKARQREESSLTPRIPPDSETAAHPPSTQGTLIRKLEAILRFFCRHCSVGSGSFPLRRVFLAAVLLYMLFFRIDPAHSSSFMWISKLLQLIKQMWRTMFATSYQALTESKEL